MTSVVYVHGAAPAPTPATPGDARKLWFESLDGSTVLPLDGRPFRWLTGTLGLEDAPVDLVTSRTPGVVGSSLDEAQSPDRAVMLPVSINADSQAHLRESIERLRDILRPGQALTPEGSFKLVCSSASGTREMTMVYAGGLEGDEMGAPRYARFGLRLLAPDPYPRDRAPRFVDFEVDEAGEVFLSDDDEDVWPRALSSSVVIGTAMPVNIVSGVPVWPRIDYIGPFDPLTVSASTGMDISVPDGVPSGQTLTIITDPRHRSIRLDGELAAGMVARGSRLGSPFLPGVNYLTVAATGATTASQIRVSWLPGWRTLW